MVSYLWARPDDHALDPEPDESGEGPERLHDVRVVGSTETDHGAQLRVAVCSYLRARKQPYRHQFFLNNVRISLESIFIYSFY